MKKKLTSKIAVAGLVASTVLAGCAIRPLPKDFGTGITPKMMGEITTTTAIVSRIRCEARHAIAKVTMGFLESDLLELKMHASTKTEKAIRDILIGESGKFEFDKLVDNFYVQSKFKKGDQKGHFIPEVTSVKLGSGERSLGKELEVLASFANSGVGYQFDFEITENNNANTGKLDFNFPLKTGSANLGLGANYTRQRKNKRTFTIVERIEEIVFDPDLKKYDSNGKRTEANCDEINFSARYNPHFPIYGKIDLLDSFSTFAGLVLKFGLGRNKLNGFDIGPKTQGLKTFASQDLQDQITFMTEVSGSANPSVTLMPLQNDFHLASASIGLENKRVDIHKLTLILQQENVVDVLQKLELERLKNTGNNIIAISTN